MSNQQDARALIAEDNFLIGEMIKGLLEEIGYTVFKNVPRLCPVMAFALNVRKSCTQKFLGIVSRRQQTQGLRIYLIFVLGNANLCPGREPYRGQLWRNPIAFAGIA